MKDKYYTPTTEEFHVGFEFEHQVISYCGSSVEWVKTIFTPSDSVDGLFKGLPNDWYELPRVKYLDREDIESLGFVHVNGKVYNLPRTNISLWYNFSNVTSSNSVTIRKKQGGMFFDVAIVPIKNKSELKKLLKQLEV